MAVIMTAVIWVRDNANNFAKNPESTWELHVKW